MLFLDEPISVTFNQPMDVESVAQNLTFQDEKGSRIEGNITWDENNTTLVFAPADLLARSTAYTLILPKATRSLGGASLAAEFTINYQTISYLNPVLTNPAFG